MNFSVLVEFFMVFSNKKISKSSVEYLSSYWFSKLSISTKKLEYFNWKIHNFESTDLRALVFRFLNSEWKTYSETCHSKRSDMVLIFKSFK
jgi:hypothetical protein